METHITEMDVWLAWMGPFEFRRSMLGPDGSAELRDRLLAELSDLGSFLHADSQDRRRCVIGFSRKSTNSRRVMTRQMGTPQPAHQERSDRDRGQALKRLSKRDWQRLLPTPQTCLPSQRDRTGLTRLRQRSRCSPWGSTRLYWRDRSRGEFAIGTT